MHNHMLPFQRSHHFEQAFDDHDGEVETFAGDDDLFFEEDGCEENRDSVAGEG